MGFWILLQLLGVGLGLASVDTTDTSSLRSAGIGTTTWSLISPLIAMFLGAVLAGKLAQTYERKVAAAHGVVMWALTSILGLSTIMWLVSQIAEGAAALDRGDGIGGRSGFAADRLSAADSTGKALAVVGFSLLLSLITAAIGAMIAARPRRAGTVGPQRGLHETEQSYPPPVDATTAPYGMPATGPSGPVPPLPPR